MLQLNNSHVHFDAESHTYTLDGQTLQGVTSTLIRRAFPHKYDGVPEAVLKRAAERGSQIHEAIEDYETLSILNEELAELANYRTIKQDQHLIHEASEYLITDGQHYASAIDLVFTREDGTIILADIKTTIEVDTASVALQLSLYRLFFLMQNPQYVTTPIILAAIWLRGDKSRYVELGAVDNAVLDELIQADLADTPFEVEKLFGTLPASVSEAEMQIVHLEEAIKEMQAKQAELKDGLLAAMEQSNVKSYTGQFIRLTRVLPSTKQTFDSKTFKADHPELYDQYVKASTTKASIRISIL